MAIEKTRSRFSAPIPGFVPRLRTAIGRHYPSVSDCTEALGIKKATIWTWLGGRTAPSSAGDLLVLSAGLRVSVDWLLFGEELRPRDYQDAVTFGERLRRVVLERFESLGEFRKRLEITGNMLRRWLRREAQPHLWYVRQTAAILEVSIDYLYRGEPWAETVARHARDPREVAAVLAARTIERMAERMLDPEIAAALMGASRRAGRIPRVRRAVEGQEELPLSNHEAHHEAHHGV